MVGTLVGTSLSSGAKRFENQSRDFYANGRYWVIYHNTYYGGYVYASSVDKVVWNFGTQLGPSGDYQWSTWFDGTYLHTLTLTNSKFYYRRGYPNSNGTFTWTTPSYVEINTRNGHASTPYLRTDSNGYVWIGYFDWDDSGHGYAPWVIKSGTNDGTWGTTPSGFPYQLATYYSGSSWGVVPNPLTNGKMCVVYARSMVHPMSKTWDGAQWLSEADVGMKIANYYQVTSIPEGDYVHITYRDQDSFGSPPKYWISYTRYSYATNSWGSPDRLVESTNTNDSSLLVFDQLAYPTKIYCFWIYQNHIYYKTKEFTGSWSSTVDLVDESAEGFLLTSLFQGYYKNYNAHLGISYMTKSASPYNVKTIIWDASHLQVTVTSSAITGDGIVEVDGQPITTPHIFDWLPLENHTITAISPAHVVEEESRSNFDSWSDAGAQSHSIIIPDVNEPLTYTAYYITQYYLEVTGGDSPTGEGWYDADEVAHPSNAWAWDTIDGQSRTVIDNWQLDGVNQNPTRYGIGTLTLDVTMDAHHTVNFVDIVQYYLDLISSLEGAPVSHDGSQTSDNWFDDGTDTIITADTPYIIGTKAHRFSYYEITRELVIMPNSTDNPLTLTMDTFFTVICYWVDPLMPMGRFSAVKTSIRTIISEASVSLQPKTLHVLLDWRLDPWGLQPSNFPIVTVRITPADNQDMIFGRRVNHDRRGTIIYYNFSIHVWDKGSSSEPEDQNSSRLTDAIVRHLKKYVNSDPDDESNIMSFEGITSSPIDPSTGPTAYFRISIEGYALVKRIWENY